MQMGPQITYDLSTDLKEHCLYGGCWRAGNVDTLAGGQYIQYGPPDKQFTEDHHTYGKYVGETGVTLYNLRNTSGKPGCLMRKSRMPVDLSVIGRIELDLSSSGSRPVAPWYSVWLAPMVYADRDDNAKAAEIDLIENYDYLHRGQDVNSVASNFAQCGDLPWTRPYCTGSSWGAVATTLHHHVTLKATEEGSDGRVIRVYHCPKGPETCPTSSPHSEIKVQKKPPPPGVPEDKWFRIWNKDVAKEHYAQYWLVADVWWTSGTDFKLSVDSVRFFKDNGEEWKMPLDGPPPKAAAPPSEDQRTEIVL